MIFILFFILMGFGILMFYKCCRLEQENQRLKIDQMSISDSIKIENKMLNNTIIKLNEDLEYYKFKVDSLNKIKQQIIVKKEYIVSEDLIDGVVKLKENLKCEKYY